MPKQFDNGGWLVGVVSIVVATLFVLNCALMLVKCGEKTKLNDYSEIALAALGPRGKVTIDIFIAII